MCHIALGRIVIKQADYCLTIKRCAVVLRILLVVAWLQLNADAFSVHFHSAKTLATYAAKWAQNGFAFVAIQVQNPLNCI